MHQLRASARGRSDSSKPLAISAIQKYSFVGIVS